MEPLPFVTLAILALTGWTTWRGFAHGEFFERLIFRPDRILRAKEYHRLLSSALLHGDWVHFGFNAMSLLAFAKGFELSPKYGPGMMLVFYVGSILGGSLLSLAIHRNHHDYSAVGASGGVCGVIFAFIFLFPGSRVSLFFIPVFVPAWLYALLFLLYSFSGMIRQRDNIGHDAHLGGALVGLALATALYPDVVLVSWKMLLAVVGLTTAFFVYLVRSPHSSLRTLFAGGPATHKASQRYQRYDEAHQRIAIRERLDHLLDKVAKGGLHRLTSAERKELERLSDQLGK